MSIRHPFASFVPAAVVAVAVAACGHEYSESSTTTTTAAAQTALPYQQAIDRIAGARCQRELRCDNVGANKHYVSFDGCTTQLRGEGMNELTTTECPRGLDTFQVNKCVADIQAERCENLLDTISRVSSCRTGSLCAR
jgi:hypothetical protein